jgi:hypothetical protein
VWECRCNERLRRFAVSRGVRTLLLAALAFCLVAPSASAAPTSLGGTLGDLWTTVLETPTPQNPFAGGDTCVVLEGNIVAPFGPMGAGPCTVKGGTKIFVTGWTTECSTFEGNGTTEAELRSCAVAADAGITATVTVDGQSVPLTKVQTGLLRVHLPKDNIFGLKGADRKGLSVADGWVVVLNPLAPGTHTIMIHVTGTVTSDVTTTIIVK